MKMKLAIYLVQFLICVGGIVIFAAFSRLQRAAIDQPYSHQIEKANSIVGEKHHG